MPNRVPPAVPIDGWMSERLADPDFAAEYLNALMEEGDQGAFMRGLRNVAKARGGGVAGIARETGMSRGSLTKALSETGNPELRSLNAVLAASGLALAVRRAAGGKARKRPAKAERGRKSA